MFVCKFEVAPIRFGERLRRPRHLLPALVARSDRQQKIAQIEQMKKQIATLQSELAAAPAGAAGCAPPDFK